MSPDLFAKGVFAKPELKNNDISPITAFIDPYKNADRADRVLPEELNKAIDYANVKEITEYSAGGIVENNSQIVLIAKKNKKGKKEWSFPKGHIEKDESPEVAAVREVWEETGLKTRVKERLGISNYWFYAGEHHIHKYVYFFNLEVLAGQLTLSGNDDEEICDIQWVNQTQLFDLLFYPMERKIAKFFFDRMAL
jgi:8-oxo-dGTP pyrophosphatase MutT (NUDIX family)